MTIINVYIIAAMAIILLLTGFKLSRKRGYIIPSRIDMQLELTPVPLSEMQNAPRGETSAEIRKRVVRAREIQQQRYKNFPGIHCNAQMTDKMLQEYAQLDAESLSMLRVVMQTRGLSARSYNRILKVARTIADLAASERIESSHIAEAIGYRNLDRSDWAERGI